MDQEIKDFTSLEVWKKSHNLSLEIYKLTKDLPPEEKYRLVDQIIRSSRSVPANIAEGYGRYYYKENISFCRKARGSLNETINHMIEAKDMGLVSIERCEKIIADYISLRMMLNGYIKYLGSRKLED